MYYEVDSFDERIEAVRNRAGRIAWLISYPLLLLGVFVYFKITGAKDIVLVWCIIIPYAISQFAALRIERRAGITKELIEEEKRRISGSTRAKKLLRINSIVSVINIVLFTLIILSDYEGNPIDDPFIFVIAAVVVLSAYLIYLSIRDDLMITAPKNDGYKAQVEEE